MANSGKLISIYNEYSKTWKTFGEDWEDVSKPNEIVRTPSAYKGYSTTAVNSGRNAQGQVIADVVIEDVAKIELKWKFLSTQEFAKLSKLFLEKYNGKFMVMVAFFDETLGDYDGDNTVPPDKYTNNCRFFYPNDRIAEFAPMKIENGKPVGYTNVSLNLIDTGLRLSDK